MSLIPHQRHHYGQQKGFLVCNSNCAVIGIVIPFAALQAKFGLVEKVSVVTMQAVSGAGYPGVSSMDILDNVVPYIPGACGETDTSQIQTGPEFLISGLCSWLCYICTHWCGLCDQPEIHLHSGLSDVNTLKKQKSGMAKSISSSSSISQPFESNFRIKHEKRNFILSQQTTRLPYLRHFENHRPRSYF